MGRNEGKYWHTFEAKLGEEELAGKGGSRRGTSVRLRGELDGSKKELVKEGPEGLTIFSESVDSGRGRELSRGGVKSWAMRDAWKRIRA